MKNLIAAMAATIFLTFPVKTYGETTPPTDDLYAAFYQIFLIMQAEQPTPAQVRAKWIAWDMLCFELRDVDCSGVKAPEVRTFQQNPFRPGLMGYYQGGDTIYIRADLKGANREEVLAHEMSHYLDVILLDTPVPGPARDICFSEKRAWAVSDAYWTKYGHPNKVVGSNWADWYSHCTPLKGEMYPDESAG